MVTTVSGLTGRCSERGGRCLERGGRVWPGYGANVGGIRKGYGKLSLISLMFVDSLFGNAL